MKIKNIELKIVKGDICALDVDAIVNAANNEMLMGGGVAGMIKQLGGQSIEDEATAKAPIEVGGSVWTKAGQLKAEYVIHAATMGMDFKTDQDKVRLACASALQCADELKLSSVAFPALGCGVGDFPLIGAAKIMTQEVLKFAQGRSPIYQSYERPSEGLHDLNEAVKDTTIEEIYFCLYDDATHAVFEKTSYGYIQHVHNVLGPGPHPTVDVIIELPEGIVIIERSNPPYGWALPGGFLDYGESLETGAVREVKEETNLDLVNLRQFHTYSDPDRDPRFHTVSTVFIGQGRGQAQFGDDARGLKVVAYKDLMNGDYAFDHKTIIQDYLRQRQVQVSKNS